MKCMIIESSPERTNARPVTNENGTPYIYNTLKEARAELKANGYSYNRANDRYYIAGTEYRAYIIREDSDEYAKIIEQAKQAAAPEHIEPKPVQTVAGHPIYATCIDCTTGENVFTIDDLATGNRFWTLAEARYYCQCNPVEKNAAEAIAQQAAEHEADPEAVAFDAKQTAQFADYYAFEAAEEATRTNDAQKAAELASKAENEAKKAEEAAEKATTAAKKAQSIRSNSIAAEARRHAKQARKSANRAKEEAEQVAAFEAAEASAEAREAWDGEGLYILKWSDGGQSGEPAHYETVDDMTRDLMSAYQGATETHLPYMERLEYYERADLLAYLGEPSDFDVEAIEAEATDTDEHGSRYWTADAEELAAIAQRNQR